MLDAVITQKEQRLNQTENLLLSEEEITNRNDSNSASEQAQADAKKASLVCQKTVLEAQKAKIIEHLEKPAREYQQYLNELKLWTEREKELTGDEKNPEPETLNGLERELEKVKTVYPESLRALRAERERISKEIFKKKRSLTQFYDAVKQSID